MHANSLGDRAAATHAVDVYLGGAIWYAYEHEPEWIPGLLHNWRRHLASPRRPAISLMLP
jgi:hypothetical protein